MTDFLTTGGRPTWATVDLAQLARNYLAIKAHVGPDRRVMAMVKANAYGHGLVPVSLHLEREAGADWFGVALPEEAFALREAGIRAPILCLGGFWEGQATELVARDVSVTVYRPDHLTDLDAVAARLGRPAMVHVKIDSGMGRLGIRPEQVAAFAERVREYRNLRLEGVLTHFASADLPDKKDFTRVQIENYERALDVFRSYGLIPTFHHLANSAATHAYPAAWGNLVRVGGLLYGIARDIILPDVPMIDVKPALSLHSKITLLKTVPPGTPVGYGGSFVTERESRIATIPIGYGDGISRAQSNRGAALVGGRIVPIVGRVSMDLTIVDVTDVPGVEIGDEVVFIGRQGEAEITAEAYAARLGSIALEATTTISARVPRRYGGG